MADELDIIRSRISIVELVSQRVSLRRSGRSFTGLCPFHEDRNPSFTVNPDLGRYRCWSCGASGDIFNWVMETQRVEFPEALQILAQQAGVTLTKRGKSENQGAKARWAEIMAAAQAFFSEQLRKSEAAKEYCQARGLTPEVIVQWGLGYGPAMGEALIAHLQKAKITLAEAEELFLVRQMDGGGYQDRFRSRLTIPIRDEKGQVIAYGGRIIGEGMPKYINSSDTPLFHKSHVLFGLDAARDHIRKSDAAVLVEGYMDVIACHRAEVRQAVASLGTSLTEDQVRLLKRWGSQVVILYDRDEAGQKAAEKATDMLLEAGLKVRIALPPPGEDPDSLLTKGGAAAVQDIIRKAVPPVAHRVLRLEERKKSSEPDYWDEAAHALSYSSSLLELEEHVAPLAASYPGAPDKAAAMAALRRMAEAAKRRRKKGASAPEPKAQHTGARPSLPSSQKGLEGRILRGLFFAETRLACWKACQEQGLFRPGPAAEAAAEISQTFPQSAPSGGPPEWLPKIAEPFRTLLGDLYEAPAPEMARPDAVEKVAAVTLLEVEEAVNRLREHRTRRELDVAQLSQQGDEAILARMKELKRRKGGT